MNRLSTDKRTLVTKLLTDGMGMRAITRVTDVAKNTLGKFLMEIGEECRKYQKWLRRRKMKKRCLEAAVDPPVNATSRRAQAVSEAAYEPPSLKRVGNTYPGTSGTSYYKPR